MARGKTPVIRWSETERAWVSAVRFPDGRRVPVKRVDKAEAQARLDHLLAERATYGKAPEQDAKLATFDEIIDAWLAAGAPAGGIAPSGRGMASRRRKPRKLKTQKQARSLLANHVRPILGKRLVDRTPTKTVESCFDAMALRVKGNAGKNATADDVVGGDTIYRAWWHLANCLGWARRANLVKTNPALEAFIPEGKEPKERRSFQVDVLESVVRGILLSDRPALWLTCLMNGLRPGELTGLRWCHLVDLDGPGPVLKVEERADYDDDKYVGQADPKKGRKRAIELHPLVVAVLQKQRAHLAALGLYDDCADKYAARGFVFPIEVARAGTAKRRATRVGEPHTLGNVRKYLRVLTDALALGDDWTTYELRHSFTSLADFQINDLRAIADTVGHVDTKTTLGYRHSVVDAVPHARRAWEGLLAEHDLSA